MGAPKGNKFWLQRSSHGRKPIFATPDDLWSAACEYFEWVHENPLYESKAFNCGEMGIVQEPIAKMRAMTLQAMFFFIGITHEGWAEYCRKKDFSEITKEIQAVIYSQKFEGASAGLLNAAIIARELGISNSENSTSEKDKIELEIKRLELEKLKKEINPPKIDSPDEDYKITLKPDEDIPDEPIL